MLTRTTVRAVVVDHTYRVLLLHVTDGAASWWEPPGGPPEPREQDTDAVARLLRAETGLLARVGPCVWERRSGRLVHRVERYHVAWVDDPAAPRARVAERERVLGERWWTLDELAAAEDRFDPDRLPALAPDVVRGDYEAVPVRLAAR